MVKPVADVSPDHELRLRLERAEALIALARLRLQPPERDAVVGELEAAAEQARRALRSTPTDERQTTIRKAEEKAAQAEADREEKRRPYEADPLFMYLWRRRMGTRDYKAGSLVRYLDLKVAHLIGFENARVNYAMLMELPDRLRAHAERMKQEGAGEQAPLSGDRQRELAQDLAAAERQPRVLALLQGDACGPEEAGILQRIGDIDRAMLPVRA